MPNELQQIYNANTADWLASLKESKLVLRLDSPTGEQYGNETANDNREPTLDSTDEDGFSASA